MQLHADAGALVQLGADHSHVNSSAGSRIYDYAYPSVACSLDYYVQSRFKLENIGQLFYDDEELTLHWWRHRQDRTSRARFRHG